MTRAIRSQAWTSIVRGDDVMARFQQDVEEVSVEGKKLWIVARSWVAMNYRFFGLISFTQVGSKVIVYAQPPSGFKDPHWLVKAFCSVPVIGWFCGLAGMIKRWQERKKYWKPDRPVFINMETTYFDRCEPFPTIFTQCSKNAECGPAPLSALALINFKNYPEFMTSYVTGVWTKGSVEMRGLGGPKTVQSRAFAECEQLAT